MGLSNHLAAAEAPARTRSIRETCSIFTLVCWNVRRSCRTSLAGGSHCTYHWTQAGDISAYIPTNVISITDGQIFLESDLFHQGVRPAINVGNSVSRVGGSAQIKAMKSVAGTLRLDLAQYRDLAAFAQFGSDLDKATQQQLNRGQRLIELLKQPQYAPMPVELQVSVIWAGINGLVDDVPLENVRKFEQGLRTFMENARGPLLDKIRTRKELTEEVREELRAAITEFKERFTAEGSRQ